MHLCTIVDEQWRISVRWIPTPGSSSSCTPATQCTGWWTTVGHGQSPSLSQRCPSVVTPKKSLFLNKKYEEEESSQKKRKKRLSSYFSNITKTRFDESSPVQPLSESRGGTLSVTEDEGRTKESLCLKDIDPTPALPVDIKSLPSSEGWFDLRSVHTYKVRWAGIYNSEC